VTPTVLAGVTEVRSWLADRSPTGALRGFVPTLGALHAGHAALIRRARAEVDQRGAGPAGTVIVSVFVNPRQFGSGEDLARYPRTLTSDVALAGAAGADLVWAPTVADVYPPAGPAAAEVPTIRAAGILPELAEVWEAAARPGHFDGVLTVVNRLLRVLAPDLTCFGEKDYQQLVLVTAMVAALPWTGQPRPEVVPVPTVRDDDGVALSSRNAFLSDVERRRAAALPAALSRAAADLAAGEPAGAVLAAARSRLAVAGLVPDYVEFAPPRLPGFDGAGRLVAAVHCGPVRLLDTWAVAQDPQPGQVR